LASHGSEGQLADSAIGAAFDALQQLPAHQLVNNRAGIRAADAEERCHVVDVTGTGLCQQPEDHEAGERKLLVTGNVFFRFMANGPGKVKCASHEFLDQRVSAVASHGLILKSG
jgi:hypothetical protein